MLNADQLEQGFADAIAAAREHLNVGTDGEVVDQVVVLATFLLPDGQTIAAASPVVKRDYWLARVAADASHEAREGVL